MAVAEGLGDGSWESKELLIDPTSGVSELGGGDWHIAEHTICEIQVQGVLIPMVMKLIVLIRGGIVDSLTRVSSADE